MTNLLPTILIHLNIVLSQLRLTWLQQVMTCHNLSSSDFSSVFQICPNLPASSYLFMICSDLSQLINTNSNTFACSETVCMSITVIKFQRVCQIRSQTLICHHIQSFEARDYSYWVWAPYICIIECVKRIWIRHSEEVFSWIEVGAGGGGGGGVGQVISLASEIYFVCVCDYPEISDAKVYHAIYERPLSPYTFWLFLNTPLDHFNVWFKG